MCASGAFVRYECSLIIGGVTTKRQPKRCGDMSFSDLFFVAACVGMYKLGAFNAHHPGRLRSQGDLPSPVRVGKSLRWIRAEIETWIEAGCPTCAQGTDAGTEQEDECVE
jgi:hypothetical protein